MARSKSSSYESTANKILETACKIFPELGFNGTSISMLAREAKINQSLIYHHFGSKEELWKATKAYLLKNAFEKITSSDDEATLEEFIEKDVRNRFEWYSRHPQIIRMLNWQRLEPKSKQLQGTSPILADRWMHSIPKMQKEGKIRKDLPTEMIITLMINMIMTPLLDDYRFLKSKEARKKYMSLVVSSLVKMLEP